MITNVLLDHSELVPVALVLVALACAGAGYLALRARGHGRRILWTLLALSVLPVLALTLVPAARRRDEVVLCVVQFSVPSPGAVELLANVALFLPPALFAVLATRRPVVVLVAASVLSAAIEGLQAVVPAIGRACDTNDWAMNTAGAVAGVLLALGTRALANRPPGRVA